MRRKAVLLAVVLVAAACGGETAATTSTAAVVEEPSTTSTSSTTTTVVETTITGASAVVLEEFLAARDVRRGLNAGVTYQAEIEGVSVVLSPPVDGWELLGYQSVGADAGALFAWKGPSGFRRETLDVLIWEIGHKGGEAAWSAITSQFPTWLGEHVEWSWTGEGETIVGGVAAPWREVRSPSWDEHSGWPRLSQAANAMWFPETSARFYLVPVGDLTVTLVGFETRCACMAIDDTGEFSFKPGNQMTDDSENELSMWIPELEAFLASMTFEAQ